MLALGRAREASELRRGDKETQIRQVEMHGAILAQPSEILKARSRNRRLRAGIPVATMRVKGVVSGAYRNGDTG